MQQNEAPSVRAPRTLLPSLWRRIAGRVSWPLVAILAVQAGFSLSLVWSNTAFYDEAYYQWQGHLEWAHWLHGYPIPVLHASGAVAIYPPLGALAGSVGGLAGARILSLCFMLGATVLLYLTASSLFGRRAAIIGSAVWALSEPVLRLAFATFDPMACLLVTLSAWLALRAGVRRRGALVAASAVALGLASATAFSFAIMIPAVVAFSFFAWAESMGLRRALWHAAGLLAGTIATIVVIFTGLHLWSDLFGATVARGSAGLGRGLGQGVVRIAGGVWVWDGLMLVLAAIGVVVALAGEWQWSRKLLLLTLVGAGLLVPAYQARIGTSVSLDKHMSAGTWFLAMAAGYGIARMTATARWKPLTATSIAVGFLAFPAITGLWYARTAFHSWPNTSVLVSRVEPSLMATNRPVLVVRPGLLWILLYATPQGHDWARWVVAVSPPSGLSSGHFGLVVMQFNSTLNSPKLPRLAVTGDTRTLSTEILSLSTNSSGEFAVVKNVEQSGHYRLQEVIPFAITTNTGGRSGLFAVWTRIGQRARA